MAILSSNATTPSEMAANQVRNLIKQSYATLGQAGIAGYRAIWNNPTATPYEVIAALGTDAQAAFEFQALNGTTLTSAATIGGTTPPTLPSIPDGWSVTFNPDGSAVVTGPVGYSSKGK